MKKQFGEEEPEARQKRQKQLVGVNFVSLALNIAMVVIGVQYNNEEDCRSGDAPKYLLIGKVRH